MSRRWAISFFRDQTHTPRRAISRTCDHAAPVPIPPSFRPPPFRPCGEISLVLSNPHLSVSPPHPSPRGPSTRADRYPHLRGDGWAARQTGDVPSGADGRGRFVGQAIAGHGHRRLAPTPISQPLSPLRRGKRSTPSPPSRSFPRARGKAGKGVLVAAMVKPGHSQRRIPIPVSHDSGHRRAGRDVGNDQPRGSG